MIQNGFEYRIKTQQLIENQLPEFILDESPKTAEFLKQYYISQEYQGGSVDISENLDQYLKLDNLTPEVVVGTTELTEDISSSETSIQVSSTKGFPQSYGLLKIGDEIITYTGTTTNTFTGCIRGFSGVTNYHKDLQSSELIFSSSSASSHSSLSEVKNLSILFLQEFYKKIKYSLTPGLENTNFVDDLNVGNFIKESRTLYASKGTDESFRILFNVLFGETPKIVNLEQFLLKPSSATYSRKEVVVAEVISGDPLKLSGQTIFKSDDPSSTASVSEVEIVTRGQKTYYKIFLFIGYDDSFPTITGSFKITGSTKNISPVSVGSSVITVDSTIGFPEYGKIYSGNNEITYTSKSVNQFFGCSGIVSQIGVASTIRSNETYYGYEDGDTSKKVEFRLTGVLSKYEPLVQESPLSSGEIISIKSIGEIINNPQSNLTRKEIFANSWVYNTSSRYQISSFSSGAISQFSLKSDIDKSSLKIGDYIDILFRDSNTITKSNLRVINIDFVNNQVTVDDSFVLNSSFNYDIRRKLNYASTSTVPFEFDSITSDIQNVYNENDEYMYVASNSLPSYTITKNIFSYNATGVSGFSDSGLYSTIIFDSSISFLTGNEIYYKSTESPISGLLEGFYYVEVLSEFEIRLYDSLSVIGTNNYVSFGQLTSGTHSFTLSTQKEQIISPQKILRKFPLSFNMGDGQSDLTQPGPVGMLVNGVEILSYKSNDKVFYGPLDSVNVLDGGKNYDVINPPLLELSSGDALVQPVISGSIEKIFVDPQDFNINVIVSATLSGGNGSGAVLEPIVDKKSRSIEFDARTTTDGGGLDITSETITFLSNHNLIDGQSIIYDSGNNPPIGISSFQVSNLSSGKTLKNGSIYYAKFINDRSIQLYESILDYTVGINTVGFTTISASGVHKFLTEPKNTLTGIKVINGGTGYTNRKLRVKSVGISTQNSTISFNNHGFSDGDLVNYYNVGIGTTVSSPVLGLSTTTQYYVLKIDDNTFRLANAGIGGTITSNYTRKNYVSLGSTGVGYHIFNYPDISLNVEYSAVGLGSTQFRGSIVATPIVKGEIKQVFVYESGIGYGSSIVNYHNKPSITIKNGKYAQVIPIIINGQITDVSIQYGGIEYYSTPDLIVSGIGTGAILKPVIVNNSIVDVIVVNSGFGYSESNTTIKVVSSGTNAFLDPQVRSLTINNNFLYNKSSEIIKTSSNNLQYYISENFDLIQDIFGDSGDDHSPIIGWAYDGNPIYGSYGYSNPSNNNTIKRIESGYSLNSSNIIDRPSGFEEGFFVEDYNFTNSGDLDEYNGRFCITKEFPNGIYAYFATSVIDGNSNVIGSFPYFIGNRYRSKYINDNKTLNQSFDFNNSKLIRNTFPYKINDLYANNDFLFESNEVNSQLTLIESITKGKIDSYKIIESGSDYKVGDTLSFSENNTSGSVFAQVSEIKGEEITQLQTTILSYNEALFTWEDGQTIKVKISPSHTLNNLDYVNISGFSTNLSAVNGYYQLGVTTYNSILEYDIPAYATTGIVTDIYVSVVPNNISIGSSLVIDNETFSILNTYKNKNILRVSRSISGGIHTATTTVYFTPDTFTINKTVPYFESKDNDTIYFNPTNSIGVGTTTGIGVSVNYNLGNKVIPVYIPTQSIYLPNHPFKNNQEVKLIKVSSSSPISVANTSTSTPFNLPISGDEQTVYIINKSVDYIGIVTQIGLTTTTNGLYFISNGSNDYRYAIKSDFSQIKGDVERITSTISVASNHLLNTGDSISLTVKPNLSVGIGTSTFVKVLYDTNTGKLIINPKQFTASGINTIKDEITVDNHGFKTGDKVVYNSSSVASGLTTGIYYVYKVDNSLIKLCKTFIDSTANPPLVVDIESAPATTHNLLPVNPSLSVIKNNNLVFNLEDPSLSGYNFKIFYDRSLKDEFVSIGSTNSFSISKIGTPGSSNASLTINYSDDLPISLFYGIENSGVVIDSDVEVENYSQINFATSYYNNTYNIVGVGSTTFRISLSISPEKYNYTQSDCNILEYTTKSPTASGGISKIRSISPGYNLQKLPLFEEITSNSGKNAYILPESEDIGNINKIRILNEGFEYFSDKTLRPQASISEFLVVKNSKKIASIDIIFGGRNYTFAPTLIVADSITGNLVNSGSLDATVNGTSISSVKINESPTGISQSGSKIVAINNDNGVGIQEIQTSQSGIVTCTLITPLNGFSLEPFSVNDKIFVEGIVYSGGDGFNSSDYGYKFFTIKSYSNSGTNLPRQIEYDLKELKESVNPGVAQTVTSGVYGTIINFNNYPIFSINEDFSDFIIGEYLQIYENGVYIDTDLKVTESSKIYVKVSGTYQLEPEQIIRGTQSGSIGTISEVRITTGEFIISYSSPQNNGWIDGIGKLNEDTQVIADNDYYQNLSYTIKSNQEWIDIVSPVNSILHTSGLKNFSDTQIVNSVGAGATSAQFADFLYQFINENRVDTINNFDLVIDVDTDGNSSRFLKFKNKKLADYIECRTNRVLDIDDISSQFSNENTVFDLNYQGVPIFAKTFNPSDSSVVNLSTGEISIQNHFFNTGEELIYDTNNGSPIGIGSTLNYVGVVTNVLPSKVYAIKISNDVFKIATRREYALGDPAIAVSFTTVGIGTSHQFEMFKKNEKAIITINNIAQYPIVYSLLNYTVAGGQIGTASTIFGLSGISSIKLGDILKIDNEFMKVINVGLGTTYSGPISFAGTFPIVSVQRGFVGSSSTTHSNSSLVSLYRGGYTIVDSKIYFTDPPKGSLNSQYFNDNYNLPEPKSQFNGRVFLRKDYTSNQLYDNISENFTGIAQTYRLTVNGINTTGIGSTGGNGVVFINGFFQAPNTENNSDNNFKFIDNQISGTTDIEFSGITSSNGSIFISQSDVNINQLPRGGMIVSLGSTPGLGYAPLVGASVKAVVGAGGSILSIGIGTTGNFGSGYRYPISISVTENGHSGVAASISATVGAGGTLAFNIVNPGTGYTNPTINISPPSYSNLPVIGVSRLGVGQTTETGIGLLLNVEVGASSTTGIGSTLFEISKFSITRTGYGFKRGDVIKPVGLVTAYGLNQPVSEFQLTVLETFSDSFASWQFGQLDYIDSVKIYQNGLRTRFPLYYNSQLLSFERNNSDPDSQLIDFDNLLLIFINGILQEPGFAYQFSGGTSFTFTQPPKSDDIVSIFFYRGSSDDSFIVNVNESIKPGDSVQAFSNNNYLGITTTQEIRNVTDISSSDKIQTNNYILQGINSQIDKPLNLSWTKQKVDKIIESNFISKSRDSLESQVYPTAKIISNLNITDSQVFVDDARLFGYDVGNDPINFDCLIITGGEVDPVAAAITATVSVGGTIQSLTINQVGSGYTGSLIEVEISSPPKIKNFTITGIASGNSSIGSNIVLISPPPNNLNVGDRLLNGGVYLPISGIGTTSITLGIGSLTSSSINLVQNNTFDNNFNEWNISGTPNISLGGALLKNGDSIWQSISGSYQRSYIEWNLLLNESGYFRLFINTIGPNNDNDGGILVLDNITTSGYVYTNQVITSIEFRYFGLTENSSGIIDNISIFDGYEGVVTLNSSITTGDTLTFSSIGTGITATATISVVNGSLSTPINITNPGSGYTSSNPPKVVAPTPYSICDTIKTVTGVAGTSGKIIGISTTVGIGTALAIKFTLDPSTPFAGLSVGYPICIFGTSVGNGVTSIIAHNSSVVGVGTTFLDNIYYISAFNDSVGIITCNIHSNTSVVGIATTGNIVGKYSWGRLSGFSRSNSPVSIAVSGYTVNSGLSTFPTIHRRKYGLRNIGSLKKES